MKPTKKGRRTEFSRELKPETGVNVSSGFENMEPEVPVRITLSEKAVEGDQTRCGIIVEFADKTKDKLWVNAEQVLALCLEHSQELATAFYEQGRVMCNIAIGVIGGRLVVAPSA